MPRYINIEETLKCFYISHKIVTCLSEFSRGLLETLESIWKEGAILTANGFALLAT